MKSLTLAAIVTLTSIAALQPANAWMRGGFGGAWGRTPAGGVWHAGDYGGYGHATAVGPNGAWHGSTYGGYYHGTAATPYGGWHTGAYGAYYHQPAVVNSYAGGCWNCGYGGWGYAGAAAAGAVVGAAATAAAANAAAAAWPVGVTYAYLPPGCVYVHRPLRTFYQCPAGWLAPAYGANGLYYRVVPGPT